MEGAHAPEETATLIRSTFRHIFIIIIPTVIALIIICPWLVRAFGEKYENAVPFMRIMLVTCLPKAISTVYYAYCRIQRSTYKSAMMQAYVCITMLSAIALLVRSSGLIHICLAILAIQTSAGVASWWVLRRRLRIVEHREQRARST